MTLSPEPEWMAVARSYIGEREIKGRQHNPLILRWWTLIHAGFSDDETPWCAGFVGGVLEEVGIKSSRSAAARSYLKWGRVLNKPIVGCIAVLERGPRNGHVGFVVGMTKDGRVMLLGGNQGDAVNIAPFPAQRVLGWRWPESVPIPEFQKLPVISTNQASSRRESLLGDGDIAGDEGETGDTDFPVLELPQPAETSTSTRFKHVANFLATGAATGVASLLATLNRIPFEVVALICLTGLIVFGIIWFTSMRRGCHSGR